MTKEEQAKFDSQEDKKQIEIVRADNGYMVRCFPEFKVFTNFADMIKYLSEKLEVK